MTQCWGRNKNLRRCRHRIESGHFCGEHRLQPVKLLFYLVFTVFAGGLAIYQSCLKPDLSSGGSARQTAFQTNKFQGDAEAEIVTSNGEKPADGIKLNASPALDVNIDCCDLLPPTCGRDEDYESRRGRSLVSTNRTNSASAPTSRIDMNSEYIGAVGGRIIVFSVNGIVSDVYNGERPALLVLLDRVLLAQSTPSNEPKNFRVLQLAESNFDCSLIKEMRWPMYSCPFNGDVEQLRVIAEKDGGRHISQAFVEKMSVGSQCTKQFHFAGKDHFVTYISAMSGNRMDKTAILLDSQEFWHFESYENFVPTTSDFPVYVPLGVVSENDWELFNEAFREYPRFIRVAMTHPKKTLEEPGELVVSVSACSLDSAKVGSEPIQNP